MSHLPIVFRSVVSTVLVLLFSVILFSCDSQVSPPNTFYQQDGENTAINLRESIDILVKAGHTPKEIVSILKKQIEMANKDSKYPSPQSSDWYSIFNAADPSGSGTAVSGAFLPTGVYSIQLGSIAQQFGGATEVEYVAYIRDYATGNLIGPPAANVTLPINATFVYQPTNSGETVVVLAFGRDSNRLSIFVDAIQTTYILD
jgi:hypothetical protein